MAREDVNIKVSANVAEAIQLWKAMEQGPQGMARELGALGAQGKGSAEGMAGGFEKVIGKFMRMATLLGTLAKLIKEVGDAEQRFREGKFDVSRGIEEQYARYQVQAGVRGKPAEADRDIMLNIAKNRGVNAGDVMAAGTQFISSGWKKEDVIQGGVLNEFLRLTNATNAIRPGMDPAELAKSLTLFMKSTGQELTLDSMRQNNVAIAGLFKGTNLQIGGLNRFSEEAGQISSQTKMDPREMLSMYSTLLDVAGEAKASVAFRSLTTSLSAAGANSTKTAGLKAYGLKPEDVDYVGEDNVTVLKRLKAGRDALAPEKRAIADQQVFGAEGGAAVAVFLQDDFINELDRRNKMTRDVSGYNQGVATSELSDFAELRRAEVAADVQQYSSGSIRQMTGDIKTRTSQRESGVPEAGIEGYEKIRDEIRNYTPKSMQPGNNDQGSARIKVEVQLVDQNRAAIPHKSIVHQLSKPNRNGGGGGRQRGWA